MAIDSTSLNTINGVSVNDILSTTTSKANDELGKDAFLQLLVTQMQYQDPLDPQDNGEYIAQLAQFSSLEQMTNLNETLNTLSGIVNTMNTSVLVGQLSGFIGKNIEWTDSEGNTQSGVVDAVKIVDGQPYILVGDQLVDVPSVETISAK